MTYVPGKLSLWRAVNHAKDINSNELPSVMVKGDNVVKSEDLAVMMNRLTVTNNKIDYKMLNLSKDTYKLKCKNLFLQ